MELNLLQAIQPSTVHSPLADQFPCLSSNCPHVKVEALCDDTNQSPSGSRVSVSYLRRPSLFERPLTGRIESERF